MSMEEGITFDKEKAEAFRDEYIKAVTHGKDTFIFEGKGIFTDYGKYMCEHLANVGLLPPKN